MTTWRVLVSVFVGAVAGWLIWFLYVSWSYVSVGELAAVSAGALTGVVLGLVLVGRAG
jgi:hypothetical protein